MRAYFAKAFQVLVGCEGQNRYFHNQNNQICCQKVYISTFSNPFTEFMIGADNTQTDTTEFGFCLQRMGFDEVSQYAAVSDSRTVTHESPPPDTHNKQTLQNVVGSVPLRDRS